MPININQVVIGGRIAGEPKTQQLPNGSNKARFALAISRFSRNQDGTFKEETSYINVEAFGYLVDRIMKNLHKGTTALVTGQIREDHWEDRSTGTNKFRTYILAEQVQFVGSGAPQAQPEQRPAQKQQSPPPPPPQDEGDDIPF
jgi:single-strand DNA-binding protein